MPIDPSLLQSQIALAGIPRTMPNRWSNLNQSVGDFGGMLGDQYKMGQQLQLSQAQQLAQWKMFADMRGGSPQINQALASNPYGRFIMQNSPSMGQSLQGQQGGQGGFKMNIATNPLTGSPMMVPDLGNGGVPGGFNMSGASQPVGGQDQSGQGANFSQFNPVSSSPVVTSVSQTTKTPFDETSVKEDSPEGAAKMAAAQEYGKGQFSPGVSGKTKLAEDTEQAQVGAIRDDNQLRMQAQILKNLVGLHGDLEKSGLAGNEEAKFKVDNYNKVPSWAGGPNGYGNSGINLTSPFMGGIKPEDQQKIGQFVSARNEALIRTQPILTQQFGQAGSTRIMESVLKLAGGELGDLSTPHAQMIGQAQGTLGNLVRIKLASNKYFQDLQNAGKQIPTDENEVAQGIYKNMTDLTPPQEEGLKQLQSSISSGSSGSWNPAGQFSQSNQQNNKTIKVGKYTAY